MSKYLSGLVLLGVSALVQPSSAATFSPAPQASYLIDLDTPSQHLSVWDLNDLGTLNALRATVKINAIVPTDGKVKPGFLIGFTNGDEMASVFIADAPKGGGLVMGLGATRGDKRLGGGGVFLSAVTIGIAQAFDLAIDWTADGKLTATLNGRESYTVQLSKAPTKLEIEGSSGEIELNPLTLGRSQP